MSDSVVHWVIDSVHGQFYVSVSERVTQFQFYSWMSQDRNSGFIEHDANFIWSSKEKEIQVSLSSVEL